MDGQPQRVTKDDIVELVGTTQFRVEQAGKDVLIIPILPLPRVKVLRHGGQGPLIKHRRLQPKRGGG